MSTVFLQVGQCGNQVGQEFWKLVDREKRETGNVFHARDGKLRSINVDSEPKVVKSLLKQTKKSWFADSNLIIGKRGRGTNWALGYHGSRQESENSEGSLLNSTLECLRKEVEKCDSFSGIVLLHSMSGGTGSGLGSRLCEALRDDYQMPYLMSIVVAPHSLGESPLQHYNSLLCLAWLQRYTDCVMLFQNDDVLYRLKRMAKKTDLASISMSDMNQHIAACLSGVFLPINTLTPSSGFPIGAEPWEMVRSVCPMPSMKFTSVNHTSKSKATWESLCTSLLHTVPRHDESGQHYSCLSSMAAIRGDSTNTFHRHSRLVEEKIKHTCNFVDWNPFPVDFWIGSKHPSALPGTSSMSLVLNSSSIINYSTQLLHRSQEMFDAKAYLHWYWKHGCQQEDFEESFETVQTIVSDYSEAVR
ncbi:tubulin delta chain-like [Glandiceps talaboti]